MSSNVRGVSFTLPPALIERIGRVAEADRRSRSFIAAVALQAYCDANERVPETQQQPEEQPQP